ncbi:hypothetical protein EVB91_199 [Rhizobium phage RHph_I1_18]|nr:hypothetical protein EVB91_199 [Rhizobium phage RHph_I1_18]
MSFVVTRTEHGWKRGETIELTWCSSIEQAKIELHYIGLLIGRDGFIVIIS